MLALIIETENNVIGGYIIKIILKIKLKVSLKYEALI